MSTRSRAAWLVLVASMIGFISPRATAGDSPHDSAQNDAGLNDVQFMDRLHGWAVGDRGAIWHTGDGGMQWQLQPSGTVVSLTGVSFVDERTGWVVGGQGIPYSPASSGLVLATTDGGQTWRPTSWGQHPRFRRVQFTDVKSGWVWGESTDTFPSGLYGSESGGQMWHQAGGSPSRGWLGGFFPVKDAGVLSGLDGSLAVVIDRSVHTVATAPLGARSLHAARVSSDQVAWVVGDGGLVLRSDNLGNSWSVANGRMTADVPQLFDWRGVAAFGPAVWVVGRPGSVVMFSPDSGGSWKALPTGSSVPLEAVHFVDRQRGWAAGALGTILATQDGGRSWQVQRRGGERAAVLAVHGDASSSPLLAHVKLGADQGYFTVDLAMVRSHAEGDSFARATAESRLSDAASIAGAAWAECEWRFPANPVAMSLAQVIDDWNRRGEGRALRDLERRLALAIRTWRPEIIVADSPEPAVAADSASALVSQAVERAFHSAADSTTFPELHDQAQLAPWAAKKLYFATRGATQPDAKIDANEPSRSTGQPILDQACLATSLLVESYRPTESHLTYRLAATRLTMKQTDNSFMAGIALDPGGPARRKLLNPVEVTEAERVAEQQRRNLFALVDQADTRPVLAQQLTAQVQGMLKSLPPERAGNLLFDLAQKHFARGRWSDCRELMETLCRDYPQNLNAGEAHRWLIQFYASSEARHREHAGGVIQQIEVGPTEPTKTADRDALESSRASFSSSPQGRAIGGMGSNIPWARGAVETARRLSAISPLASSDPSVQFPVASAQRLLGNVKDAERYYLSVGLNQDAGPWAAAAWSERWIRDREGMPKKPVAVSRRGAPPPHLDGAFDDAIWKGASPVSLGDLSGSVPDGWETQLRMAHDEQFLYFAISCNSPNAAPASPVRPRPRDANLSEFDHVDLTIDLDRDYATYYHLAVDRRGCVAEDCWGDRSWNPTWYVASQSDERGYRIEAAIPLTELTDDPIPSGTVWAFNAVRVVPGERIMAWSRPAGLSPRLEGLGYLFFTDAAAPPQPRSAVAN